MSQEPTDTSMLTFPSIAQARMLTSRVRTLPSNENSDFPSNKRGYSSLSEQERVLYFSYLYGWRRFKLKIFDDATAPFDREKKYHKLDLIELAEQFWIEHGDKVFLPDPLAIRWQCEHLYGKDDPCTGRFLKLRVQCFRSCPHYGLVAPHIETPKEELARVYRQRAAEGRAFPVGLPEDHPDVLGALFEDREWRAAQDRELAQMKTENLSDEEYAARCVALVRANLSRFKPKAPAGWKGLGDIAAELGVRATEQSPAKTK